MSTFDALNAAGTKPAGKRPYFLEGHAGHTERALAITMAVVQELAVARQRVDTLERLLQAKGVLAPCEIELYAPGPADAAARALWTQEYIARVLRIVQQEGESAGLADEPASEDVAVEVARTPGGA